jgi:hypothetical protein
MCRPGTARALGQQLIAETDLDKERRTSRDCAEQTGICSLVEPGDAHRTCERSVTGVVHREWPGSHGAFVASRSAWVHGAGEKR